MMEGVKVRTIRATSRASIKVKDSFYTLEYCEERELDDRIAENEDLIKQAREELWDCVNAEVDNQIEDVLYASKNR